MHKKQSIKVWLSNNDCPEREIKDENVENIYSLLLQNKELLKEDPDVYCVYGEYYYKQDDYEKSKYYLNKAYNLDNNNAIVLNRLGYYYLLEDNNKDAFTFLKKSADLGLSNGMNNLAIYYQKLDMDKECVECYQKAYDMGFKISITNLAIHHFNKNRYKEALECALKAKKENITFGSITNNISTERFIESIYIAMKDKENALKYINKGLAENDPQAYLSLSQYYKYVEYDPTKAIYYFQIGFSMMSDADKRAILKDSFQ